MISQGAQKAKNSPASAERIGQGVDVGLVVVEVERRPGGGADAEPAHERLGAVVAGAHAHAVLVEHLGDVVRVDVARSVNEITPPRWRGSVGPWIVMSSPKRSVQRARARSR